MTSRQRLDFFADGRLTAAYEALGFYSSADFVELGAVFGVGEDEVRSMLSRFAERRGVVEDMTAKSLLSDAAKSRYLAKFEDRLKAIAQ